MFGRRSVPRQASETYQNSHGGEYEEHRTGMDSDSKKITRNYRDEEVMRPPMVQLDKKTGKGRI